MGAPMEPSAELRLAASSMRQMFAALVSEGFTEAQALTMVSNVLAAGIQAAVARADDEDKKDGLF